MSYLRMQQSKLLNPGQETPSTSCQISVAKSHQHNSDSKPESTPPQGEQQQHHHQLESSTRYSISNSIKAEDNSLLASSGYRSQTTSAHFSPSNDRTISPESESKLLIEKSLCCCCRTRSPKSRRMSSSNRLLLSYFLAEMFGTFVLVLIGDGSIAAYVVTKHPVNAFNACFAFGVGAMVATYLAAKISGAHLNPAATLAIALDGKLKWRLVPVYMLAQYLGGFLAALLLYINYIEAIGALDGGSRSAFGHSNSTGTIFATYPGEWVSVWGSILDQILGTAMLLFALSAVTDKNNGAAEDKHQPLIIAFVIGLICFAFSPNCGAIFNPARDLAPRLLSWLVGYSSDVWAPIGGYYWLTAGLIGPHVGAILGYFGYKYLIGSSLNSKRQYELEQQDSNPCRSIQSMTCATSGAKQMPSAKLVQIAQQNYHHHQHHHQQEEDSHHPNLSVETSYGSAKR